MKKILAVDDERHVLNSLRRVFRDEECLFIAYESPVKALDAIQELKPDVIISDKRMPEMGGLNFLSKAMELYPRSVRILISGFGIPNTVHKEVSNGNIDFVMYKPWNNDELRQIVIDTFFNPSTSIVPIPPQRKLKIDQLLVFNSENASLYECSLCSNQNISHELRHDFTVDYICSECDSRLRLLYGSEVGEKILDFMAGNFL